MSISLKKKLQNWGVDRNIWKKTRRHDKNPSVLCGSGWLNNCTSLAARQQQTALQMMGVRKLIKYGRRSDAVGSMQGADVLLQGLWVAGNIKDVLETAGERQGHRIEAATWRVDEERRKIVAIQINRLHALEWTIACQCFADFVTRHAH